MRACRSVHGIGLVGTQQQAAGGGCRKEARLEGEGRTSISSTRGDGHDLALPSTVPGPEGLKRVASPAGRRSPEASLYRAMESTPP